MVAAVDLEYATPEEGTLRVALGGEWRLLALAAAVPAPASAARAARRGPLLASVAMQRALVRFGGEMTESVAATIATAEAHHANR